MIRGAGTFLRLEVGFSERDWFTSPVKHKINQATYSDVTPSGKIENKVWDCQLVAGYKISRLKFVLEIPADIAGCSFEAVAAAAGGAAAGGGCTSVQMQGSGYSSGCIQDTDCSCYSSSGCSCPDCILGCSSGCSSVGGARGARGYKTQSHNKDSVSLALDDIRQRRRTWLYPPLL